MRRGLLLLLTGLAIGELGPLEWATWRIIAARLPAIKSQSLTAPSPFQSLPHSRWIAESPNAYAIEDRYDAQAPVHLLVIPKQRYTSLLEAPSDVLGEMLVLARTAAAERGIAESGFRLIINTNPQGVQTSYHLHMHVLGGAQQTWPLLPYLRGHLFAAAE
jgi:histidine triad (HIT) family protein